MNALKMLRAKLADLPKTAKNSDGQEVAVPSIFSDEELEIFLEIGATTARSIMYESGRVQEHFQYGLHRYSGRDCLDLQLTVAAMHAFQAQALKEAGREFTIVDGGVSYDPPKMSEKLIEQYEFERSLFLAKAKFYSGKDWSA